MICAWDKLLQILPIWMREEVDQRGKTTMTELCLRLNRPPELHGSGHALQLSRTVRAEDLRYLVNAASNYSPWTAESMSQGYLTAAGGHRIGLCGEVVIKNNMITGFRKVSSACVRVARDFPGVSEKVNNLSSSILLIGPPGSGKTTLLRDLIRRIASESGNRVAVVDERHELFPEDCFSTGKGIDVLSGCGKSQGIDILLRTMGPNWIAVDEITEPADCKALIQAGWCGVRLLATAHAADVSDLRSRAVYRPIIDSGLFPTACVLRSDKTYRIERIYV